MKHVRSLLATATVLMAMLSGASSADAATIYSFYEGGVSGNLVVQFTTPDPIIEGTHIDPFSDFQVRPAYLPLEGQLRGSINTLQPEFRYSLDVGSFGTEFVALFDFNPAPIPTAHGTYLLALPGWIRSVNFDTDAETIHARFDTVTIGDTYAPPTTVPEPGTLTLVGLGAAALVRSRRRRTNQ